MLLGAPDGFDHTLGALPDGVKVARRLGARADMVVLFTTERRELSAGSRPSPRPSHPRAGFWVAWPKKAAKVPTDMTEDVVREVALPKGLVDNKVCAIDDDLVGPAAR